MNALIPLAGSTRIVNVDATEESDNGTPKSTKNIACTQRPQPSGGACLKDSELTAITGVDGGRGGAVEGDVVINGETALSCIMSLIRKFYALAQEILRSRLNCQTDNCRRVFCTKELALSSFVHTHRGRR